jgi:hypothetical protein
MEVTMKKAKKGLPEIPDYPDAPLPAWKHYGITRFADLAIQDELERIGYSGYLVGLAVQYTVEDPEKTYSMIFGKVDDSEESLKGKLEESPLTDKFLLKLHEQVQALIYKNTPDYAGTMNLLLKTNVNGASTSSACHKVAQGECNKRSDVGKYRICTKRGNKWSCTHKSC